MKSIQEHYAEVWKPKCAKHDEKFQSDENQSLLLFHLHALDQSSPREPLSSLFHILPCSKTPDSKDQDQYQACAKLADELRIWIRYVEIGSKPKTGCIGTHKDLETHALFHVSTLLWVKCIRECGEGVGQIWKLLGVQSLEDTFDTHIYFHRLVIQSKKMYVLLTSNFSSPP